MDDPNFDRYRRGQAHGYFGGDATRSPVSIRPPRPGRWHVTVDLGGSPAQSGRRYFERSRTSNTAPSPMKLLAP